MRTQPSLADKKIYSAFMLLFFLNIFTGFAQEPDCKLKLKAIVQLPLPIRCFQEL